ncbi:radical SAM protein [Herbivorax sp. ANBcel31]|uniref:radical SAM protein n=1 Tax=Herbivorax sp. ANBcel31 TaxID=3069754 RepID=UPI0027B6376F|nr:radical SAM protein [Herbivorax sp. ANBcel31]MDQ2087530.1 radical SAM protein [Herbivorax sp. ANBcel31]
MIKVKNIRGFRKSTFIQWVKVRVFIYFLPELIKGKMGFKRFIEFLKRLLYFLSKVEHNKFVKIGKNTRLDLYIPSFPLKAFFASCEKVKEFKEKLPCTVALISVTSACKFNCKYCYQKNDIGKDVDINKLVEVVKKLQNMGVAFFNIEGGDPFLKYERLKKVCQAIDKRSEIWVNSTGYGITLERLKELKKYNVTAIMFSLHTPYSEKLNDFMGDESAWETMVHAIELCHKADIAVAFNSCISKEGFYNGDFEKIMEKAKEFGGSIIQIIKPKPSGGALKEGVKRFSEEDILYVKNIVNKYNLDKKYREYPSISAQVIEEDKTQFGCTAGGTDRIYINAKGDVQPCEFLNMSFGNIEDEPFEKTYKKMRDCFLEPGECWLCEKYSKEILKLYEKHNLKSLPLPPEISQEIYKNWDRGSKTKFYKNLGGKA